jgi:hypothetical protein
MCYVHICIELFDILNKHRREIQTGATFSEVLNDSGFRKCFFCYQQKRASNFPLHVPTFGLPSEQYRILYF